MSSAVPSFSDRHNDVDGGDGLLRVWLLEVDAATTVSLPPPNSWGRRATLPFRAVRRLAVLVSEVGPQQAAVVSTEYVRRRLTDRA